jgi:O-antigen/teichoic acid export membrane protein
LNLVSLFSQVRVKSGFQTTSLFILDGLANILDFAFHFSMGRALTPSDFAILQTLNSLVLIYFTASSVFQPVVSRFVAEARGIGQPGLASGIFQTFFRAAMFLGAIISIAVFIFSTLLGQFLNLPGWSIQISSILIFLSTLRPVAAGILQGQERFLAFGLMRLLTAGGRLALALLLVQRGLFLVGAVVSFPAGWLVGVGGTLLILGRSMWVKIEDPPTTLLRRGWNLSLYALIAYISFMSLTSLDLVWVNRSLSGDLAGAYATLVLLRRVIALLPAVAVVVMFPQVATTLAQNRLPDRLLLRTAGIVGLASGVLTFFYFVFRDQIILKIFGPAYLPASQLLGWMGVAMTGVSLSSIWLNYYLADQPRSYILLLAAAVVIEWLLLTQLAPSMNNAVLAFGLTGWFLTISGTVLYLGKTRPDLLLSRQGKREG